MNILNSVDRHVGQSITVFTTSGGITGRGFTGVLIEANCDYIKLLCEMPMPPSNPFLCNRKYYNYGNPFGSVAIIPIRNIASIVLAAV